MTTDYICPSCKCALESADGALSCGSCGTQFGYWDGIPVFTDGRDFYYGELQHSEMETILAVASADGMPSALTAISEKHPYVAKYILSGKRSAFGLLLNRGGRGRAIDVGCGWGNVACELGQQFDEVYAVDATKERARFSHLLAKERGLDNVHALVAGLGDSLPFGDGYFDAAVLNGVLEWVPEGRAGNPWDIQREFLVEIRRILGRTGVLYIGIENRFAYPYFLGRREDHTNLRFASLLPRWLADLYSCTARGRPYRTYTYSRRGYRLLLRRAGFSNVKVFLPVGDYRFINGFVDPSDPYWMKMHYESRHGRSVAATMRRRLSPLVSPAFSITAAMDRYDPVLEGIREDVSSQAFGSGNAGRICRLAVTDTCTAVMELGDSEQGARVAVKIPLSQESIGRCSRENGVLQRLSGVSGDRRIPLAVCFSARPPFPYFAQTYLPGTRRNDIAVGPMLRECVDFLDGLRTKTGLGTVGCVECCTSLFEPGSRLREHAYDKLGETLCRSLSTLHERQSKCLAKYSDGLCLVHGDFWAGNLRWDGDTLVGVLDWDSCFLGMPGMDVLHLLLLADARTDDPVFGNLPLDRVLSSGAGYDAVQGVVRARLGTWDREVARDLLFVHAVFNVIKRISWHIYDRRWVQKQVEPLMHAPA